MKQRRDTMSDRFYQQKCDFFRISPAELIFSERYPEHEDSIKLVKKMERKAISRVNPKSKVAKKKRLKADVILGIHNWMGIEDYKNGEVKGLDKLKVEELEIFLSALKVMDHNTLSGIKMPTGKGKKKPYTDTLHKILGECEGVDFTKLTIATIKEFLGLLGI